MSTNSPLSIMLLTVSTRPGAVGPAVADWFADTVASTATSIAAKVQRVSLADLDLPFLDEEEHPASGKYSHEHTKRWSALVDAADGFIVVSPEYNFGMAAPLKNALDYLYSEWAWKPMAFVSYGNTSAGIRAVQHAKQVISTLRIVPTGATVALRFGDSIQEGRVQPNARLTAAAEAVMHEVVRLSHALSPMRESIRPSSSEGPVAGSYLRPLDANDAGEVIVLQRASWVDEARANDMLDLPALTETVEDVAESMARWEALGLFLDGRLIGMVRTTREGEVGHIGRLAVVPDLRGAGVGRWLLREAEARLGDSVTSIVLFTGAKSQRNIALYESEGYELVGPGEPGAVKLTKRPGS